MTLDELATGGAPAVSAGAAIPRVAREATRAGTALAMGLCAAILFASVAGIRLGAQGPEYDELHQATGSFTHLGSRPELFSVGELGRYPVLNTTYSAAIKTHLFGLYLRWRGEFRLVEWRAFGIACVGLALVALSCLAATSLPPVPLGILLLLLVADGSLMLLGRHDWGPVDLAFLLRCLLLGSWLRLETSLPPGDTRHAAGMGLVTGIALVEKLSSVVLIVPLVVFLVFVRRRRRAVLAAAAAGLAAGAAPLAALNVASHLRFGFFVSLRDAVAPDNDSISAIAAQAASYLGLGSGTEAAALILGLPPSPALSDWERGIAGACLALAGVLAASLRRVPHGRRALLTLAGYAGVFLALVSIPRATWIHHWLAGTPLQYLGVALALAAARAAPARGRAVRILAAALWLACAGWLALRATAIARIGAALADGRASARFDPDFIELGELAARQAPRAVFVATDWGVATQIYCFANGRDRVVHELFWGDAGAEQVRSIHRASGKPLLYLVRLEPPRGVGGRTTHRIESEVAAAPDWVELPLEPAARAWPRLRLRKYRWASQPLRSGHRPGPPQEALTGTAPPTPALSRSSPASEVLSQVNPSPSRPKWP